MESKDLQLNQAQPEQQAQESNQITEALPEKVQLIDNQIAQPSDPGDQNQIPVEDDGISIVYDANIAVDSKKPVSIFDNLQQHIAAQDLQPVSAAPAETEQVLDTNLNKTTNPIENLGNLDSQNPIQQLANDDDEDNMNIMPDISNLVDNSSNVLPLTLQNDLSSMNVDESSKPDSVNKIQDLQGSDQQGPPVNSNPNQSIQALNKSLNLDREPEAQPENIDDDEPKISEVIHPISRQSSAMNNGVLCIQTKPQGAEQNLQKVPLQDNPDDRGQILKKLLIKFRKSFTVMGDNNQEMDDFAKLLDLNSQLATPKSLCLNTWSLVNEKQSRIHVEEHNYKIIKAEKFPNKEQFLEIAKNYGKCQTDDNGSIQFLVTPTSAPPMVNNPQKHKEQLALSQAQKSQNLLIQPAVQSIDLDDQSVIQGAVVPGQNSQRMMNGGNGIPKPPHLASQKSGKFGPQDPNAYNYSNNGQMNVDSQSMSLNNRNVSNQGGNAPPMDDNVSMMNSQYNMQPHGSMMNGGVNPLDDPFAGMGQNSRAKPSSASSMFDDDGSANTGIEIIRLNKKFDIFMKRFMRAEEDIKEVKQNFYRVMHCAFAKYEQGFKRKNEYLERRRVKRREEIEKGVQQELKKRGMNGELDDPLLLSGAGPQSSNGGHQMGKSVTNTFQEDSSLQMINGMGGEDSNLSISNAGKGNKILGIEDSELSNAGIVGTGHIKKAQGATLNLSSIDPAAKRRKKEEKKRKKQKKRHRNSSSDSDKESAPLPKGQRGSARFAKQQEEEKASSSNTMTIL